LIGGFGFYPLLSFIPKIKLRLNDLISIPLRKWLYKLTTLSFLERDFFGLVKKFFEIKLFYLLFGV